MSLELCVLASGSSGNCTLIKSGDFAILIDAGLRARELVRRLEETGTSIEHVRGVCISHEHSDHTAGLAQLASKHGVPVYANRGTIDALMRKDTFKQIPWKVFSTGQAFEIDDVSIEPFSVPHDAYEPVGFIIDQSGVRIGVVSDMGIATSLIRTRLKSCRAVIVEANHDEKLLANAKRPEFLKQRIRGRQGHLSNQAAAELLAEIAGPQLEAAYLAHLSEDCNRPEIAMRTIERQMEKAGHEHVAIHMTYSDKISAVWSLKNS